MFGSERATLNIHHLLSIGRPLALSHFIISVFHNREWLFFDTHFSWIFLQQFIFQRQQTRGTTWTRKKSASVFNSVSAQTHGGTFSSIWVPLSFVFIDLLLTVWYLVRQTWISLILFFNGRQSAPGFNISALLAPAFPVSQINTEIGADVFKGM